MGQAMGPYTQLHIRRVPSGQAITLKVLQATADRLGWSAAFLEAWDPSARRAGASTRRQYGAGVWLPNEGGWPSGVRLTEGGYGNGLYPRLRFRVTGPWTRSDLEALRLATVPEVHAITAGRLRWCRLTA